MTICESGMRASIAASVLTAAGSTRDRCCAAASTTGRAERLRSGAAALLRAAARRSRVPAIAARSSTQCASSRVTRVSSTSVPATGRSIPSRWCSTEITLPRSAATSDRNLISSPGRSASCVRTTRYRPADVRPCRITEISIVASMFPPEDRHRRARSARPAGEERGDADRPGAFDHELRALEQQHDRLADLLVRDGDDVVQQVLEERHRKIARVLHGNAVRDRVAVDPGLDADDSHFGPERAQCSRDAEREPTSADRDQTVPSSGSWSSSSRPIVPWPATTS